MKKFFLFFFFSSILLISNQSFSELAKGKWIFVKDDDYCYIGSLPTLFDVPEGKQRGDAYILVYKINKNPEAIVQINAGYPYKDSEPVMVSIDKASYDFYSQDDSAWTDSDDKIIYAMKKGVVLKVTGISSRGTKTVDEYTLKGFTAAFNKLANDC